MDNGSVSVSGVSLSPAALTLDAGQSQTLTAAVEPENAANKALTWASDKPGVAMVDENGKVTGVAVGTAAITVTTVDGGKTAVCAVTVQTEAVAIPVTGVSLDRETLTLGVNQELTLTAAVEPENAADKAVTWASDKPGVAKVDENGKVTGVAVGTATVTVTTEDGGKTAVCVVTVQTEAVAIPVTGVSLPETLTLSVGASETLIAAVTPPEAENTDVTWASDKPGVAAVDGNGVVTGVAVGTATVTVTTKDGGKTDTCTVTVQQEAGPIPVTGVSLIPKTLSLAAGTTGALTAAVAPSQAANKAVTWTSSDPSVAAVDNNGTVSALAEGEATITVTTVDGGKTDTCAVTVNRFTITNTGEWNSAIEAVKNGGNNRSYTLDINGTVSVPGTEDNTFGVGAGVSVTVQGSGELALTSRGRIFTLGAGQTLILGETGGSGPTLRGLGGNGNDTSTVRVDNGGTLIMNNGTITGNTNKMGGESGGVHVNGGAFTMNGGTISDNSCKNWGGGVYVRDGTFTMKDGTISSNRCDMAGGGVYVYDGAFTMNGGTISGNRSTEDGGGVYVDYSSTFTMNSGTISSNRCDMAGGGVYVFSGTFTMNSGTISTNINNGSRSYGGGVYVGYSSTFTMNDGTISANWSGVLDSSTGYGGGVYVDYGTFTMTGGTISSNMSGDSYSSTGYGGGVYVTTNGEFTKSGESSGSISSNSSKSGNGTQVYYNVTPPKYRNSDLEESDNINTTDPANWTIEEVAE